ncbi:hypothetical protein O0544_10895 [Edwardsiella anguillarum]|nr:hypothetical protein [Edwardsiella anguillarum]
MGQLIPALLAGGACALGAFLLLPARTSRRYRRRLPRVLLHQLGETCRWLAYLPAVRDFNQLAPALKKATFNRQATLQRLLSAYHAGCDGGGALRRPLRDADGAGGGVITLSYWPVEPLGRDDLRRVNALRRRCFLALASLLCRVESLDYRQRAQQLTALRQWLACALPEGASHAAPAGLPAAGAGRAMRAAGAPAQQEASCD